MVLPGVPATTAARHIHGHLHLGGLRDRSCVTSVTDPAGRIVHYSYDSNGNLTGVQDVGGAWTSYGYDNSHRLTSVTDADGNTTSFVYNSANQVTSETDPLNHTITWAYSLDGNGDGTTTVTDPLGYPTLDSFTAGLLTAKTQAAGTTAATHRLHLRPRHRRRPTTTTAAGTTSAETTTYIYNPQRRYHPNDRRRQQHHHHHLHHQQRAGHPNQHCDQ